MSFVAGFVRTAGTEQCRSSLQRLQAISEQYGGGGKPKVWYRDGAALAQTQAITTFEDRLERLPAVFAGGRSSLAFEGRLDNRGELAAALGFDPPRQAAMGDGAIVMAALERWGLDACVRLLGDFALAWWDRAAKRLVLACDACGGRTVYAHAGAGEVFFATRLHAVLGFPQVPRDVDAAAMAYPLLMRVMPAGRTPYRDVFSLPPGSLLTWTPEAYRIERWWQPSTSPIRYGHDSDYVEAARELLDRAVGAQLRADKRAVCFLSGGLDSAGVAATAARLTRPGLLHTLTSVPDPSTPVPSEPSGLIFDEWPLASATAAAHPNIVAHRVPAGELTVEEFDPSRLFAELGFPIRNFLNFGAWRPMFVKARELGASVILGGASGNATLSWQSEALLADLLRSGRLLALAQQVRGLHAEGERLWPHLRRHMFSYLAPRTMRRGWRRLRGLPAVDWSMHSAVSREFAARVGAELIVDEALPEFPGGGLDARKRLQILESNFRRRQMAGALTHVTDCELRDPLCDRRLVEFCLAIPAEQWQLNGVRRSFARRVLADRVPREVYDNRRRGRQCADWFHRLSHLRHTLHDEIDRLESSPLAREMLDLPRLKALAADWPADADAAQRRAPELLAAFGRGINYGKFVRWVEGGNR